MNNGALIDAMEDDIKSQDITIKELEEKNLRYENALVIISTMPVDANLIRYVRMVKQIADEALLPVTQIESEIKEISSCQKS